MIHRRAFDGHRPDCRSMEFVAPWNTPLGQWAAVPSVPSSCHGPDSAAGSPLVRVVVRVEPANVACRVIRQVSLVALVQVNEAIQALTFVIALS